MRPSSILLPWKEVKGQKEEQVHRVQRKSFIGDKPAGQKSEESYPLSNHLPYLVTRRGI